MGEVLKALLVEASADDARLVLLELGRAGIECESRRVLTQKISSRSRRRREMSAFLSRESGGTRRRQARSALELIAASAPDLVLMDLMLPRHERPRGDRPLRAAEATRSLGIIAAPSYRCDFPAGDCALTGADGYIAKPYHYAQPIDLAREVFQRPREQTGGGDGLGGR